MAKVLSEIAVCQDCLMVIANGDASGIDSQARVDAVERGMERLTKTGYVVPGDSENDREFSRSQCDCCLTRLAGSRHQCFILGD